MYNILSKEPYNNKHIIYFISYKQYMTNYETMNDDINILQNINYIILKENNLSYSIYIDDNIKLNMYNFALFEELIQTLYTLCPNIHFIDIRDNDNIDWYIYYEDYVINGGTYILHNNKCYGINKDKIAIFDNEYNNQLIYGAINYINNEKIE